MKKCRENLRWACHCHSPTGLLQYIPNFKILKNNGLVDFFSCFFFHVLFPFYSLVFSGIMPLISRYYLMVGLDGLGLGLCTLCARSSLGRRCALVKWSQPPSSRMKLNVSRIISSRQHSGKIGLFAFIFPICTFIVKQI